MQASVDRWFVRHGRRPSPRVRLFCFPYAGGGASAYASWGALLPSWLEVCAVQPPARENRSHDRPFTEVGGLVAAAVDAVQPLLDAPCALFGCSHGAVVAFEFARALRRARLPMPVHLFAAARVAPHCATLVAGMHRAADDVLLDYVRQLKGGQSAGVLEDGSMRQLMLPALRTDLAMHERYVYTPGAPLACPVSAIGGESDSTVTLTELDAWRLHTAGGFRRQLLPGGHFFMQTARDALLTSVRDALS